MKITVKQKQKINQLAQKYHLKMILLFGSQAEDKTNFASDFDIACSPKKDLNIEQEIELNCDLMPIFHSDKIDLVNLKKANPFLKHEIAQNSQLLFGNEIEYLEFKAAAFRDYIESQSLFDLQELLMYKKHKLLEHSLYA